MPRLWQKVHGRPYFQVAQEMLDEMEKAIIASIDPTTGRPMARMARSLTDLEAILAQGADRPVACIHAVEGGHAMDGRLENLVTLFERGVASLAVAHFFEWES